jgi:hypothetical protein
MRILLAMLLLADQFDPTSYLRERVPADPGPPKVEDVKESEAVVKGVRYRVLRAGPATVFLPKTGEQAKPDLERALCLNDLPVALEKCTPKDDACFGRNRDRLTEQVSIVRAEVPLQGSLVAYAAVLGDTIKRRCGGVDEVYFTGARFTPEIGVSWKGGPERQPTTYSIYNQLFRGLGFRADF